MTSSLLVSLGALLVAQTAPPTLPASSAPQDALKPLAFMAGRWVGVNPNGTVNEEHWTLPRGNNMVGTFRQIRRDGDVAFVEITLIYSNKDGVFLETRHLHSRLEVPVERKDTIKLKLKRFSTNRVEFHWEGEKPLVQAVIYRLNTRGQLLAEYIFPADSREKGFTLTYVREDKAVQTLPSK